MGAAQCSECCTDKNDTGQTTSLAKVGAVSAWAEEEVSPRGQEGPAYSLEGEQQGSPLGEVAICIERDSTETIGINLDVTDCVSLIVVDIFDGAIKLWNAQHPEGPNLQVNDRIVSANGQSNDADKLLTALKHSTTWTLVVQRPVEFKAVINRAGSLALGMDLRYAPNGTTLMISEVVVEDGPIKDWNALSTDWRIKKFDRIIELNGVRGSSQELLHAGMDKETLHMCILHYGAKEWT